MKLTGIKRIPGFPGYYAALNGDIWSGPRKHSPRWNKLRPDKSNGGHLRVTLCKNGRPVRESVHRLILITFVGPAPRRMVCCHNNGIPTDNHLENLRWDTRSNNMKDDYQHGVRSQKGENNNCNKLNTSQVRIIRRLLNFGTLTQMEIGKIFGVSRGAITGIKHNANWKTIEF